MNIALFEIFKSLKLLAAVRMATVIIVGGLSACSSVTSNYPSVADIDRITQKLLTPDERKKAIDDMALENQQLRSKTIKAIEKH